MFTEYEVQTFLTIPVIKERTEQLRSDFIKEEAQYLEINTHDFLSLVLMTPAVGLARANKNISLFEEIALNKMARKMSKGGYFLAADPVAKAMKFFIKSYEKWEDPFLEAIKLCMQNTFDPNCIETTMKEHEEVNFDNFPRELMVVPYILVRYLVSFFLQGQTEIVSHHTISKVEFDTVKGFGKKLEIDHLNIFKAFLTTFKVK